MLNVAEDFALPLDLVVQQVGILARTGAGKTNTAVVIAEELLAAQQQIVILDPPGAWWGLRSSYDGDAPGYPVIVLGGDHGDLPLESSGGGVIADLVVDEGVSVVLDLSNFSNRELTTFVTAFAERLYFRKGSQRDPMLLIVEEADEVAPQRPMHEQARMLGAMERLVKRGRMRGVGTLLITQRSASLNKNLLSQIEVLIALQTTDPRDIKAIDEWVERHGDQERRRQLLEEIASLPTGTAFVWSPAWLRVFRKVAFRRRRTYDSSATPKPGERRVAPKTLADVDLVQLETRLAATIERAKHDDPRELRRRIAELALELGKRKVETVIQRVEVPVLDPADVDRLAELARGISSAANVIVEVANDIQRALSRGQAAAAPTPRPPAPTTAPPSPAPRPPADERNQPETPALRAGERRMLQVLALHRERGLTRQQLATLSGFTVTGGTFGTYLGTLRRNGFIHETDVVMITAEGLAYLGENIPPALQTTEDVLSLWRSALRAGERRMLDELVRAYPNGLIREDLAILSGFTESGGTFGTYLSTLRRNGLAEIRDGFVRASDALFLGRKD